MKSSVVEPDVDDNNSNKEEIQKTNTVVCKFKQKKRTDAVVCNSRYNGWNCLGIFLPRQTMKNRNLPRHLPRQLPIVPRRISRVALYFSGSCINPKLSYYCHHTYTDTDRSRLKDASF